MCGIAGFLNISKDLSREEGEALAQKMTDAIQHRGPDGQGIWSDRVSGIFFGHRRLSIIDLSAGGAQPMHSHNNRYVISYNGEIYNFREIRRDIEAKGTKFKSASDTEVLLEAFVSYGIEKTLQIIKGMFAIALWDKHEQKLHLMRDHLGKKPLYVGFIQGKLAFASELKALRALPQKTPSINREALTLYTRYGYVPAPHTIYQNIYKLHPAHILSINVRQAINPDLPSQMKCFWTLDRKETNLTPQEQQQHLKVLLQNAVKQRMIADVPLGAFLSGGIDSSLVTALMQEISPKPVETFCIGFEENGFDETAHAAAVAKHLRTRHNTFQVTDRETRDVIPLLPDIYDEPFADYSQIPTYQVCSIARQRTTVALSGDGGDELFCGYSRYFMIKKLFEKAKSTPMPVKAILAKLLLTIPEHTLDKMSAAIASMNGKRLHSIAKFIVAHDFDDLAQRVMSLNQNPSHLVVDGYEPETNNTEKYKDLLQRLMQNDIESYLPDDILVKVDRASMAVPLEVRAPLLDKDIAEFAWTIPSRNKIFTRQMRGKKPLYDLLQTYVPADLINRPKQGFSVPMAAWLRGPLKNWAEDLLSSQELIKNGLFEQKPVRQMWQEFQTGTIDHHAGLWAILMAQAWHNRWNKA